MGASQHRFVRRRPGKRDCLWRERGILLGERPHGVSPCERVIPPSYRRKRRSLFQQRPSLGAARRSCAGGFPICKCVFEGAYAQGNASHSGAEDSRRLVEGTERRPSPFCSRRGQGLSSRPACPPFLPKESKATFRCWPDGITTKAVAKSRMRRSSRRWTE